MGKVLGLAGSPRKGGNTDLLLAEFLRGARTRGYETETIFARELKIAPCSECNTCFKTGECVVHDDMDKLYKPLVEADHVVVATPIFFMGPPAQLKALIDRCQALWAKQYILKFPLRDKDTKSHKGFLIATGALSQGEKVFQGTIATVQAFFYTLGIKYSGELLFHGVEGKGDILTHKGSMEQAFLTGQRFVS